MASHDRPDTGDEIGDVNKLEVLCLQSKKIIYTVHILKIVVYIF
jgi:hypothetical protein